MEKDHILNHETGIVTSVKKYLITLEGLPGAKAEDLIVSDKGARAIISSFKGDNIKASVLDQISVHPGDRFTLKKEKKFFSFGEHLFGRVINALGDPIDSGRKFPEETDMLRLDVEATGMNTRAKIKDQLLTGVSLIDIFLPIAKGQRQLLFGPLYSGKTSFLLNIVENQKDKNVVCIYALIGKPVRVLLPIIERLHKEKNNPQTIVMAALSDEPSPMIAITPSVAMLLAEHFRDNGKDVLLIFDDLAMHARYLREIALLEERLPGRESYPGDIFYQHARIIERAGKFNDKKGNGSITLLPILETEIGNFTDLIPTNLMAATDGHYLFSSDLNAEGVYPSITEDQSVTRVGKNSQQLLQKQLATQIAILLAQYKKEKEYVQFGAQVSDRVKEILKRGDFVYTIFNQDPRENLSLLAQTALLTFIFTSFCINKDDNFMEKNKQKLVDAFTEHEHMDDIRQEIKKEGGTFKNLLKLLETKKTIIDKICQ